ncbi:MAG: hypothetical protein ABI906_02110 [Pseudomonadota bacterium]
MEPAGRRGMILHPPPGSSELVRGAAAAILLLHIGGATAGLVSGGAAMVLRKGERLHRAAGNVFFVSILIMSGIGAAVAPFLPQRISSVAGGLTFYLVATAWATVRRKEGQVGRFEVGALLFGLGVAMLGASLGWQAATSPKGMLDGLPYQPAFIFGALAGLGAALDLRVILRGGVSGAPRITRHLWRMCLALLITAFSFVGQPKAIPEFLRGSPILFLPILAVAASMIYWLIRVRFTRAFSPGPAAV